MKKYIYFEINKWRQTLHILRELEQKHNSLKIILYHRPNFCNLFLNVFLRPQRYFSI